MACAAARPTYSELSGEVGARIDPESSRVDNLLDRSRVIPLCISFGKINNLTLTHRPPIGIDQDLNERTVYLLRVM